MLVSVYLMQQENCPVAAGSSFMARVSIILSMEVESRSSILPCSRFGAPVSRWAGSSSYTGRSPFLRKCIRTVLTATR